MSWRGGRHERGAGPGGRGRPPPLLTDGARLLTHGALRDGTVGVPRGSDLWDPQTVGPQNPEPWDPATLNCGTEPWDPKTLNRGTLQP